MLDRGPPKTLDLFQGGMHGLEPSKLRNIGGPETSHLGLSSSRPRRILSKVLDVDSLLCTRHMIDMVRVFMIMRKWNPTAGSAEDA